MADAPNPDPTSGHEHLFHPVDIDRALLELRRISGGSALRSSCVLCGTVVDLTATLDGTSVAHWAATRDRAARAAAAGTGPPAWGAGVPVEPS